jgi:hypothetical protein
MKQYKVLRNCWGYQLRAWKEGAIVDLPDNATPPHHFELIGTKPDPEVKTDSPVIAQEKPNPKDVMAPRTFKIGDPIRTQGGFAAQLENTAPKEVLTASQAFKRGPGRPKKS